MLVGGAKRRNITSPNFIVIYEIPAPPAERWTPELREEQVGRNTCMTTISVRECVNQGQPVMESRGDLIWRERAVLDPVAAVINQLTQFLRDARYIDTDIFARQAITTRPCPDLSEESLVQPADKADFQDIAAATSCPRQAA